MTPIAGSRAPAVLERGRAASPVELRCRARHHTLRLDPADPRWPDRDRFLLGKGHVAVGQWPVLADLGYLPASWLDGYGRAGSPLTDHPDGVAERLRRLVGG